MRNKLLIVLACSMLGLSMAASAQSINAGSNSTTNVTTGSQSGANAQTNGNAQNIEFNSNTPTHTTQTVRAAPGMGSLGFGTSFSSDNCANTIAGQLSLIGAGASMGKAVVEDGCFHLRMGYAFGQGAAFAAANHQADYAAKLQSMSTYAFCTANKEIQDACMRMGLITSADNQVDSDHPMPAPIAQAVVQERRSDNIISDQAHLPNGSIPSRPPEWTNERWVQANTNNK